MVWEHVGRWAVVPVILFDIFKAAVPVWLGLWLGLGMQISAAAGLAAAVGHNWSIFFHFQGGRGMGTFAGVWLAIYPWGLVWMVLWLGLGWRLGDSAPFLLGSLLTLPILAHVTGGPEIVAPLAGAMILITLLKRLEGNRRPLPPPGPERIKVILRRAFLDRDVGSHEEWIQREPEKAARMNSRQPTPVNTDSQLGAIRLWHIGRQLLLRIDRLEPGKALPPVDQRDGGPAVADERPGIAHKIVGHIQPVGGDPRLGKAALRVGDQLQRHLVIAHAVDGARLAQDGGHIARAILDGDLGRLLPHPVGLFQVDRRGIDHVVALVGAGHVAPRRARGRPARPRSDS